MTVKKVLHPNKVGKTGPKKKDLGEIKIQISGPYLTKNKVEELGGKDVLKVKVQDFVNNLK